MLPHQERVILEKQELDDKISKLRSFSETSFFLTLPEDERDRMHRQYNLMRGYSGVLQERIDNFSNKTQIADKTLHNTTASQAKDNVKDIVFWGDGDTFKLISKASSKAEGWMKSTKAMAIEGIGCVVQVTTQQGSNVAEAVTFVPGAKIQEVKNDAGQVIKRRVVSTHQPDVVTISNPVTAE